MTMCFMSPDVGGPELLSKEELIAKLKVLNNERNTEVAHMVADKLLLEYINDPEITEAFTKVNKWYS